MCGEGGEAVLVSKEKRPKEEEGYLLFVLFFLFFLFFLFVLFVLFVLFFFLLLLLFLSKDLPDVQEEDRCVQA